MEIVSSLQPCCACFEGEREAEGFCWEDIVAFINNHERSEDRLANNEGDNVQKIFATMQRSNSGWKEDRSGSLMNSKREVTLTGIECFNCGESGHMARNCRKPRRARRGENNAKDERDSDSNERTRRQGTKELVKAATVACSQFSSDEEFDDTGNGEACYAATMQCLAEDKIEDTGGGVLRAPRTKTTARRGRPFRLGQ